MFIRAIALHDQVQRVQVATLWSQYYPTLRALVLDLSTLVPPSSRDGEREGFGYTSHDGVPLVQEYGPEIDKHCRPHL